MSRPFDIFRKKWVLTDQLECKILSRHANCDAAMSALEQAADERIKAGLKTIYLSIRSSTLFGEPRAEYSYESTRPEKGKLELENFIEDELAPFLAEVTFFIPDTNHPLNKRAVMLLDKYADFIPKYKDV